MVNFVTASFKAKTYQILLLFHVSVARDWSALQDPYRRQTGGSSKVSPHWGADSSAGKTYTNFFSLNTYIINKWFFLLKIISWQKFRIFWQTKRAGCSSESTSVRSSAISKSSTRTSPTSPATWGSLTVFSSKFFRWDFRMIDHYNTATIEYS